MSSFEFECASFLCGKRSIIQSALRNCVRDPMQRPEPEEVMGHLMLVIKRRRPAEVAEGNAPEAYLDQTIRLETAKMARRELLPRWGPSRRPIISLDAEGPPEPAVADDVLGTLIDREDIERLLVAIDRLHAEDRGLIRGRFGIDCEQQSWSAIAERMGISPQAAKKRLVRAIEHLHFALRSRHAS